MKGLVQTTDDVLKEKEVDPKAPAVDVQPTIEDELDADADSSEEASSTAANTTMLGSTIAASSSDIQTDKKVAEPPRKPRKLIEEEQRLVGRISGRLWKLYVTACGGFLYWFFFGFVLFVAALTPVIENSWLR